MPPDAHSGPYWPPPDIASSHPALPHPPPPPPHQAAWRHHCTPHHAPPHHHLQHSSPQIVAAPHTAPHFEPAKTPYSEHTGAQDGGDDDFDAAYRRFAAAKTDYGDPELQPYKIKIVQYGYTTPIKRERQATVALSADRPVKSVHQGQAQEPNSPTEQSPTEKAGNVSSGGDQPAAPTRRTKGKQRGPAMNEAAADERTEPARPFSPWRPHEPAKYPLEAHPAFPPYAAGQLDPRYPYSPYGSHPVSPYYASAPAWTPGIGAHYSTSAPFPGMPIHSADPHLGAFAWPPVYSAGGPYAHPGPWAAPQPWVIAGGPHSVPAVVSHEYGHDYKNGYQDDGAYDDDAGPELPPDESSLSPDDNGDSQEPSSEPPERPRQALQPLQPAQPRVNLAQTLLSRHGGDGKRRNASRGLAGLRATFDEPSLDASDDSEPGSSRRRPTNETLPVRRSRMARAQSVAVPRQGSGAAKRARSVGASLVPRAASVTAESAAPPRRRGRPPKIRPPEGEAAPSTSKTEIAVPGFEALPFDEPKPQYPDVHTLYVDKARRVAWMLSKLYQRSEAAATESEQPTTRKGIERQTPSSAADSSTPSWCRWTSTTADRIDMPMLPATKIKAEEPLQIDDNDDGTVDAGKRNAEYTALLHTHHRARGERDFVLDFDVLHHLLAHPPSFISKSTAAHSAGDGAGAGGGKDVVTETPVPTPPRTKAQRLKEERKEKARMQRLYARVWRVTGKSQLDDRRLWTLWVDEQKRHQSELARQSDVEAGEQQQQSGVGLGLAPSSSSAPSSPSPASAIAPMLAATATATEAAAVAPPSQPRARLPFLRRNLRGYAPFLPVGYIDSLRISVSGMANGESGASSGGHEA